jgi:hypothetical protein
MVMCGVDSGSQYFLRFHPVFYWLWLSIWREFFLWIFRDVEGNEVKNKLEIHPVSKEPIKALTQISYWKL